jgi:hypothetical protein
MNTKTLKTQLTCWQTIFVSGNIEAIQNFGRKSYFYLKYQFVGGHLCRTGKIRSEIQVLAVAIVLLVLF